MSGCHSYTRRISWVFAIKTHRTSWAVPTLTPHRTSWPLPSAHHSHLPTTCVQTLNRHGHISPLCGFTLVQTLNHHGHLPPMNEFTCVRNVEPPRTPANSYGFTRAQNPSNFVVLLLPLEASSRMPLALISRIDGLPCDITKMSLMYHSAGWSYLYLCVFFFLGSGGGFDERKKQHRTG